MRDSCKFMRYSTLPNNNTNFQRSTQTFRLLSQMVSIGRFCFVPQIFNIKVYLGKKQSYSQNKTYLFIR